MTAKTLHIRCGDDLRAPLAGADLPGDYLTYLEPLCDGPTPDHWQGDDWTRERALWLADRYGEILASILGHYAHQQEMLGRLASYEEVVLWFEHDLFDQSVLIDLLTRLPAHPAVTLVQADRFLAPMTRRELRGLYRRRQPVSEAQITLARTAVSAWRAPDPTRLAMLAGRVDLALPHLASAIRRHLANLPGVDDGLSMTERLALRAVADGAVTDGQVFTKVSQMEPAAWLGDIMFFPVLRDLAGGMRPLLAQEGGRWTVTPAGAMVLMGQADNQVLNPRDRWVGGIHLTNPPAWRWDWRNDQVVPG